MESLEQGKMAYPAALVDWAGHHSGGVKRLLDPNSGQPNKHLLRTNLLSRLESWVHQLAGGAADIPRIVLLVGGPGNGKTEAIDSTIRGLDKSLGCNGRLIQELSKAFHPPAGTAVPRLVRVDAGNLAASGRTLALNIVQDASATAGQEGKSAPVLLIEELGSLLAGPDSQTYLCCVNRGVLDDALIHALENNLEHPRILLEAITRAVGLAHDAPSCWPLHGFPSVAVWPMDAESLLVSPGDQISAPAAILFDHAIDPEHWLPSGTCSAGTRCPFCTSQAVLMREEHRTALLQILRWYELASGKRWSFRDIFSLVSYLLAGYHPAGQAQQLTPCDWARNLIQLDSAAREGKKPRRQALVAIFQLATSSYQHALFHRWDKDYAAQLRQDLKDLGLDKEFEREEVRTLMGLYHFLHERKAQYIPATISTLLDGLVDALDPALASPDSEVQVSSRKRVILGELDIRFSRSISGGIEFIHKFQVLSANELELLKRLSEAEILLSSPTIRRKKPVAASHIQRVLRDFAGRLVRRSLCTRSAVVADAAILQSFQQVVEDDEKGQRRLYDVAKQVKNLLNNRQAFEVSLTTTFGQPLPPQQRQATLVVPTRQVRMLPGIVVGRPRSPICFIEIGSGQSAQPIALTYDLFKAVKELERGLSPASLPRTVLALLDTTRARLSGPIVRDQDILTDAKIRIGADGTVVVQSWDGFVAHKDEGQV
jgi:hypothetical protein